MSRLKGFDYRRPYFYMVTLKRLPGLNPFSRISNDPNPPKDARGRPHYLIANDITTAFARVIRGFAARWRGLAPIETFIVMPDHLHLLLKLEDTGDQLPLGSYVHQLMRALAEEYWRVAPACAATGRPAQDSPRDGTGPAAQHSSPRGGTGPAAQHSNRSVVLPALSGNAKPALSGNAKGLAHVFAPDWHDWIVKKDGQLAGFTRYIRENAERAWLRKQNARFFGTVRKVTFLGREWFAYGNLAILDLPVLLAVKGHRATKAGTPEWEAMVEACERIGPGGAGVGTFMSPLEKDCGNAIARAGGKWVVLSPEGFHARWHPPREKERFCAEGRMLFLSLYAPLDRLPTKAELYRRCHDMGNLAVAGLPAVERGATGRPAQHSSPCAATGRPAQHSPPCAATGRPAQHSNRSVVLPALSGNAEKPALSGNAEKPALSGNAHLNTP